MPRELDIGQKEKDWFIVKDLARPRSMPLMVGDDFVDHKIFIGSKVIALREVAGSGVIVKVFISLE